MRSEGVGGQSVSCPRVANLEGKDSALRTQERKTFSDIRASGWGGN